MGGAKATSRALLVAALTAAMAWAPAARADEPEVTPRHYIFGSGIALLMNRVSLGYELFPRAHHSIGLSVFGMILGITHGGPNVAKGTVVGAGGELGYRYYAGDRGPSGPFMGLSIVAGYYHSRADLYERDDNSVFYKHYGGAIDMGWSAYLDRTTIVGVALGAQRTWVDDRGKLCDLAQLLVGDGVRPRAQIQVGRVF